MDSLIETFHIDWRLLLGQMINFAVVFAVLYWFVFRPLFKTVDTRNKTIEKGLSDAEQSAKRLESALVEQERILDRAKLEAGKIMKEAKKQGEERSAQIIAEAKTEIGKVIGVEKQKLQQEKALILDDLRRETAALVVAATGKLLGEKIDAKDDGKMIKKAIEELGDNK